MSFFKSLGKKALGITLAVSGLRMLSGRDAKKAQKRQEELQYQQQVKADQMAAKQESQRAAIQKKISLGRVKSARRSTRGGLFGDAGQQQYNAASRLGG